MRLLLYYMCVYCIIIDRHTNAAQNEPTPSTYTHIYIPFFDVRQGFFSVCGYMLADVMCDAIIVERSKLEPEGKVID